MSSPGTTLMRVRRDLLARLDALARSLDESYSLKPWLRPWYWGEAGDRWTRSDMLERLLDHFQQHATRRKRSEQRIRAGRQPDPQATASAVGDTVPVNRGVTPQ